MLEIAAGARSKTTRNRRVREDEEGTRRPNQERDNSSSGCSLGHQPPTEQASSLTSSRANSSSSAACQNKPIRYTAPAPFQGGRCTFGIRTGKDGGDALDALARRPKHASMAITGNEPPSAWGPQERAKLNEICECSQSFVVVAGGACFTQKNTSD